MKSYLFTLLVLVLIVLAGSHAQADPGTAGYCSVPHAADIETESRTSFCNIYDRQLAYGESGKAFRAQLKARQESFESPRSVAYKRYREQLDARYDKTTP